MLELTNFLVCERIEDAAMEGSFNLFNVTHAIGVLAFPATVSFMVYMGFQASGIGKPFTININLVDGNKNQLFTFSQDIGRLPNDPDPHKEAFLNFGIGPMTLPSTGAYFFNVKFNTVLKRRYRLLVVQAQPIH